MAPSGMQIILVILLLVLLFGRGRISSLMGEVAKGIKSFRSGLKDDKQLSEQDDDVIDVAKNNDNTENKE
ncbi:MAG: twin-arginine translocase TatA/TatE family subunit [Parvibaculales bacterium]